MDYFSPPQLNVWDVPLPVVYDQYPQYQEQRPELQQPASYLPLYAPVPLSGASNLLDNPSELYTPSPDQNFDLEGSLYDSQDMNLNFQYSMSDSSQPTFPTPSELLANEIAPGSIPDTIEELPGPLAPVQESVRKARRRAVARTIGFLPTDPDTISSHDKKRHYLECLEQYILYLHHQFEMMNLSPPPLERFAAYGGLSNQSVRTLLVHMEHTTRRLNQRTLSEEQKFILLRDELHSRENASQ